MDSILTAGCPCLGRLGNAFQARLAGDSCGHHAVSFHARHVAGGGIPAGNQLAEAGTKSARNAVLHDRRRTFSCGQLITAQRGEWVGTKVTTAGLVARIGYYMLVIQERDEEQKEFDYTVIPLRASTTVRYT